MRSLLAALFLCLAVSTYVAAKPAPYRTDTFAGDRWLMVAQLGTDVSRAARCPAPFTSECRKPRKKIRPPHERVKAAPRSGAVIKARSASIPFPVARPVAMDEDQLAAYAVIEWLLANGKVYVRPLESAPAIPPVRKTLLGGLAREIGVAFGVPARFVRGRLICAVNVNAALSERGIKGTGSALAKSFLRWGRPSKPVPGAVAVFNRGRNSRSGHVAIVHSVKPNGMVIYLNPSARRQAWVVAPYRARPIAFRVPS